MILLLDEAVHDVDADTCCKLTMTVESYPTCTNTDVGCFIDNVVVVHVPHNVCCRKSSK